MMSKNLKLAGQFLLVTFSLVGSLAWLWFGAYTVTLWGKVVTLWGLAITYLPLITYVRLSRYRQQQLWKWANWAMILFVALILVVGVLLAPSGNARPGSPISQHFSSQSQFPRYTLANIVPEIEQINLGFVVTPYLDAIFTHQQARRVAPFTLQLYQEMDANPDFWQLGSTMGLAYADLLGLPFNIGHYYLYIPQHRPAEPLPAIIFLHGAFGNFKTYTWVWSRLAEQLEYVIIAPSFGFGQWQRPEGIVAVQEAIADAQQYVTLAKDQIYLAGLSNGGLGVSFLAQESPQQFRGLIFISPVMAVDGVKFQQAWHNRPVLVITGEADERIPISYVNERVALLQRGGVTVSYLTYPNQDHFLFFSQADDLLQNVAAWLLTTQK